MMHGELKYLHSPDVDDLENWSPGDGPFGIFVQAMIGLSDKEGAESFDIIVCTPDWFAENVLKDDGAVSGRHTLFMKKYDYGSLKSFIERAVRSSTGDTWPEVAQKLAQLGHWEFEDYTGFKKA